MPLCDRRVTIVTGAAAGIGREHPLELARHGSAVVVNNAAKVDHVVEELCDLGAVASREDVSSWDGARVAVETALAEFGELQR